ncbi:MAG: tRNA guanosine(34) transglycosylase Tgt [Alphaproteobacteria bacterium]|nr:tRNA guanosine(34) transglycosylase Tgt [Alphaproteobacteria bacterium]
MTTHFTIKATDGPARLGTLKTAHGDIRTPAFMPVGTVGTVKGMKPDEVKKLGADILLGNTYHLMLRPTAERVAKLGGLHKFMNWHGPILTDSGGFQVMSLAKLRKINENGVTFQSHLDGTKIELSPERSMEIQHLLGADITMAFDECTPFPATHEVAKESMELSMRWAQRSKDAFASLKGLGTRDSGLGKDGLISNPQSPKPNPLLFGIVQGGVYKDLREISAEALKKIGFDGYAIGGLAVGEGQELMFQTLDITMPHLPKEQPRYLMGVGKPDDIIGAVMRGVDMFDCVIPTRSGRNARGYTFSGEMNLRNAKFADDNTPLEARCPCTLCTQFSRAYLHHLFKSDEMLGPMLLTEHNLTFYQRLMAQIREAITHGKLTQYHAAFMQGYHAEKD